MGFGVVVFMMDQLSKFLASRVGWVTHNRGIAFSWEVLSTDSLVIISSILILLMTFWWLKELIRNKTFTFHWSWSLFFGGAVSNTFDRWIYQGVRDWLPIPLTSLKNNVADWAIFLGVLGIIWLQLKAANQQKTT